MGEEETSYSQADVDLALARVAAGEKKAAVARTSPVPLRTLFRRVKRSADCDNTGPVRPGPKPLMSAELERDLAEWIAVMQRCGMPVGRKDIIAKASAILAVAMERGMPTRSTPTRILTGVSTLFYTLAKLYIELKIDATRIFNMDETSFMPKTARRKVVAVRGSANVWRKETKPLSMVDLRARSALYRGGGVKGNIGTAEWLKHREAVIEEVRNELLLLPPATVTGKKRKRTTVDVAGRLVTKERLLAGAYE
ncbi:hypothetical protein PR003_g18450 [Phytophthora rubi]|uniref:HTH CENPB-type domain-containing protein n=1 Tax=Phytophthora rubi TaxID=129364 RepID=A0A6A3KXH5_9STRA|nr:hypothetical protein PR001_g15885 [Phytophthora rubi]KAE9317558.1 hypothetical protein PR003_g18450 [Phytophthora rubi]